MMAGMNSSDTETNILLSSMKHSTAERCIQLANTPSINTYYALKVTIENSLTEWLLDFLDFGGMDSFLNAVVQLSGNAFTSFSDAIIQLDCVTCIRAVLNTKIGLRHFVQQDAYTRKLTKGLDTGNTLPKKHVFELLTAVCVHSERGYNLVVDGLEQLQLETKQPCRWSVITTELSLAEGAPYKTTLMAFINAIIKSTRNLQHRNRIRSEFIGLRLTETMRLLRKEESDPDLAIQLEAFDTCQFEDEEKLNSSSGVDMYNNADSVYYRLTDQVSGKMQATYLLHVLQDLLSLELSHEDSEFVWKGVAKCVHHLALSANPKMADELIQHLSVPGETKARQSKQEKNREHKLHTNREDFSPTDIPDFGCDSKDSGISVRDNTSLYDNTSGWVSRQGSKRVSAGTRLPDVMEGTTESSNSSCMIKPSKPVKDVKWVKIPTTEASGEMSLWGQLDNGCKISPTYSRLEDEFQAAPPSVTHFKDDVVLLSGSKCLALNMFLHRMEDSAEEIIDYIKDADNTALDVAELRYLMKVLPSDEEIKQLRAYRGSREVLGQAEQFLLMLSDQPDYRLLLDALCFKAESFSKFQKLKTAFRAIIQACRDVLHNIGFRDFLRLVLDTGNFLNADQYNGGAAGIKLSSLEALMEVKGRTHHSSLLEYLVHQVETQHEEILLFLNDFENLQFASSHNLEELKQETTQLNNQLRKLLQQLSNAHPTVKDTFEFFVEDVKQDLHCLQENIATLRSLSTQVALYFCENTSNFDLQLCLKHLNDLCHHVKKCRKEGVLLRKQRQLAEVRQSEVEEHCNNMQINYLFTKKADACSSFVAEQMDGALDLLVNQVRCGNINPNMQKELQTPDSDDNPLMVSHIPPESAIKFFPERVEEILDDQYHRDNQAHTASFLSVEKRKPRPPPPDYLASPEIFSIKVYHRVEDAKPALTHRRTHSDLNESIRASQRWKKYEETTKKEKDKQTKSRPESKCPLASLSLESEGILLGSPEVKVLKSKAEQQSTVEPGGKETAVSDTAGNAKKKPKRNSIGFFRRIGQAVLKQRNVDPNAPPKDREGSKKMGNGQHARIKALQTGKENAGISQASAEKHYAARVYQRFKSGRHK